MKIQKLVVLFFMLLLAAYPARAGENTKASRNSSGDGSADDLKCKSYGAKFGSAEYVNCRIQLLNKSGSQPQTSVKPAQATIAVGKIFRDCPQCPDMIGLPPGSFNMGSSSEINDIPIVSVRPVHGVTFRQSFAMGKTEITLGQFAVFVSETGYVFDNDCNVPTGTYIKSGLDDDKNLYERWEVRSGNNWRNPGYQQDDSHPVVCINWNDAQAYVAWLSRKTGKHYQLPTESQWEYACRAGGQNEYCGNDNKDSVAWNGKQNANTTHPVAQKQANAWGLYDMSGNVEEFIDDEHHNNYIGAPSDGSAWYGGSENHVNGVYHMLRGGSFISHPEMLSFYSRTFTDINSRSSTRGFRVAMTTQYEQAAGEQQAAQNRATNVKSAVQVEYQNRLAAEQAQRDAADQNRRESAVLRAIGGALMGGGSTTQQARGYCAFDQFGNKIRCVPSLIECKQWIQSGGQCSPQ